MIQYLLKLDQVRFILTTRLRACDIRICIEFVIYENVVLHFTGGNSWVVWVLLAIGSIIGIPVIIFASHRYD